MKHLPIIRLGLAILTTGVACWLNSFIAALLTVVWLASFEFWRFLELRADLWKVVEKDVAGIRAEIVHIKNKVGMR
jgi:hypothetical protein